MKKIIILLSVLLIIKEQNGQGLYPGGTGLPTPVFTTTSAITTGGLTTTGLINMNNFGADKKIQFQRTGGNIFSFEHDPSRFYLYNASTTDIPLCALNNGNIGIGTASPANRFQVGPNFGAIAGNLAAFNSTFGSVAINSQSGSNYLFSNQRFDFLNASSSTPTMSLLNNGNVGIGTINPSNFGTWGRVCDIYNLNHSKVTASTGVVSNNLAPVRAGLFAHNSAGGAWWSNITQQAYGMVGTESDHNFLILTNARPAVVLTPPVINTTNGSQTTNSRFLLNPGISWDPTIPLTSNVIGINLTTSNTNNNQRLRITAGSSDPMDGSQGASIDLHGNNTSAANGINTQGKLDLVAGASANATASAVRIFTNTNASTQSEKVTVLGNGNVGISTNTPSSYGHGGTNRILQIHNSGTAQHSQSHLMLTSATTAANSSIGSVSFYNPNNAWSTMAAISATTEPSSTVPATAVALNIMTSGNERMRVSSIGDVGIATTNPRSRLEISSAGLANASNTATTDVTVAGVTTINPSISGLRFSQLTSATTPVANPSTANRGVLSVDADGDVILVTDQTGASGTGNMTTSCTTPIVNSVPRMTGALTYDCGIIRDDNTNVGIGTGTTAPTDRLDINGTARVQTLPAAIANENVVMANANGQLHRLAAGPAGTFLSNNGTFQAIPAPAITNVITSPVGTFDNQLNTTVNVVTSNTVNIIKSNTLTTAIVAGGVNITSTVNGATTPNVTMATTFIPIPAANPGNDWHVGGNMIATPATEYIGTNSNNDFNIHTFAGTTGANRRAQYTADGNYDFGNNTVGLAFNTVSSAFGRNNVLGNTRNSMAIGGDNTLENDSNDIVSGRNNILTNTHQSGAIGQSNTIENSSSIVTLGQGNIVKNSNQSVISGEDMNLDGCHGCFMGGGHSDITGLMPHHLAYNMIVGYFDTILKSDHSNAYGNLSKIQYGRDNFSLGNNNSISDARRSYTIGNSNTIIGGDTNFVFGNKLTSTSGNTDVFLIGNNIDNNVSNSLKIGFKNNRTMHIGENGVGIQMDPTNPLYTPGHNLEVDADPSMSSNPGVGSNIMFRNVPIAPICDGYDRLVIAANGEIFRRTNCDDGGSGTSNAWLLGGNPSPVSFIGTLGNDPFVIHTNSIGVGGVARAIYTEDGNYMLGSNSHSLNTVSSAFGLNNVISSSAYSLASGSSNSIENSTNAISSGNSNSHKNTFHSGIIGNTNNLEDIENSVAMGLDNTMTNSDNSGIIGKSNNVTASSSVIAMGQGINIQNSDQVGVIGEGSSIIGCHGCFSAGGHNNTNTGVITPYSKDYNVILGDNNDINHSPFTSNFGHDNNTSGGESNFSFGRQNTINLGVNNYAIGNNLTANHTTPTDGVFMIGQNITNQTPHSIKMGFNNNRTLSIHERGVGIQMNPTNPTYAPNHNLEVEGGPNAPALNSNIQFNNLPSAATAGIPPASLDNVVIASNGEIYRAPLGVGGGGIANTCITQGIVPRVDASGTGNLECSQIYDDGIGGALGGGVGIDYVGPFAFTGLGAWLFNGGTPIPTDYKLIVNGAIEATIVVATSDENAKTKIEKIENASEKINLLNGKSYYWNEETMKESKVGNTKQLGFLAQEVEKVLPEAVVKRKDGKYGLQYNAFIPVLVESQKEIIKENEVLKSEIASLKSDNEILKEKFALLEKSLAVLCESGCGGLEKIGGKTSSEVDVLYQSIPNPTDDEALINYYLTREYSDAYITVSTKDGKMIQSVKLGPKKGNGSVKLTLGSFASGTYLYTLVAGERVVDTKRLQILK